MQPRLAGNFSFASTATNIFSPQRDDNFISIAWSKLHPFQNTITLDPNTQNSFLLISFLTSPTTDCYSASWSHSLTGAASVESNATKTSEGVEADVEVGDCCDLLILLFPYIVSSTP